MRSTCTSSAHWASPWSSTIARASPAAKIPPPKKRLSAKSLTPPPHPSSNSTNLPSFPPPTLPPRHIRRRGGGDKKGGSGVGSELLLSIYAARARGRPANRYPDPF